VAVTADAKTYYSFFGREFRAPDSLRASAAKAGERRPIAEEPRSVIGKTASPRAMRLDMRSKRPVIGTGTRRIPKSIWWAAPCFSRPPCHS